MQSQRLDIVELIEQNPITRLSQNYQGKFIEKIQLNFTETQQRLFIASFLTYLNYNSKTDFVIELESIWKWLGFSRKEHCKVVLEKHFSLNTDYKIGFPEVAGKLKDGINLGGRPKEKILMNIHTFKKLCLKSNTKKADEIHDYFIKLEELTQEIVNEESDELKLQLENKTNQMQLLELNLEEKNHKINLMTRKVNKYKKGESVYIFHSTVEEDDKVVDLYKLGRTKNANVRDQIHKTASYKGILLQVKCVDSVLLERSLHFLLNKYRKVNRREWFTCSFDIMKNAIDYAKYVLESDIDFENINIDKLNLTIIQHEIQINNTINLTENKYNITILQHNIIDINNFELFISEHCDIDLESSISHITLKNQYKIWAKTANFSQLKKLMEYCQNKFVTFNDKANPLVSTSKLTLHFRGISIKESFFKFVEKDDCLIESFLYQNCQRAPGFRVTMQDLNNDFEKWLTSHNKIEFTYLIKEKIKTYLDIRFIRLRTGDESDGKDNRLGGWLGFSLKTNNNPEPVKHYKPKNAKRINQRDLSNNIVKEWSSVRDLTFYINKSNTITSNIVNTHKPIVIDNIQYTFEFV